MDFDINAIIIGMFFGIIGYGAWRYGRSAESPRHLYLAVGLMGFSYFVSNMWLTLVIGGVLTLLLFWP